MAYIGRDTDKISNVEVLDNITFDGSSSYTLQKGGSNFTPSSANTLLVSINGVVQAGNFTVSGSTIDFGTAVAGTSTCDFILHYGVGLITTPADGTVTEAKIGSGAVTTAKIADANVTSSKIADASITMAKLSTSATEADNVKQRVAKAWVNFQGSGIVNINDDFNVSSITDNGTGNFTVNLSTSLGNNHGVMSGYSIMDGLVYGDSSNVSSAGSFRMRTVIAFTNASFDPDEVHVIIFGDS